MNRIAYDCLYGKIVLDDWEYELLLSPEIQRLRYIRLSNINSLLITGGADINRFEHTIGVLALAKEWLDYRRDTISLDKIKIIKAAAVFHDCLTAPLGHSLQYVFEDNNSSMNNDFIHQDIEKGQKESFYQKNSHLKTFMGMEYKFESSFFSDSERKEIHDLIKGLGRYGILISGEIDIDNMDNVVRMAYHMGIINDEKKVLPLKLVKELDILDNKLICTEKGIEYVIQWQAIREQLYNLLLLNWADFSAKAMLTYAIESVVDSGVINTNNWNMTDYDLLNLLYKLNGKEQNCSRMIQRLMLGDLYTSIMRISVSNIDIYTNISHSCFKRNIEKNLQNILGGIKCIFHPILDNKKTKRSVRLQIKNGETIVLGTDSQRILLGIFTEKPYKCKKEDKKNIQEYLSSLGLITTGELSDADQSDGGLFQ